LPTFSAPTAFEELLELIGDCLLDDETLRGDAALAVVLVARPTRDSCSGWEVGVAQDDERVRTAQLQDRFLSALPAAAATNEPAPSEPVSVTPATRRSETMPSTGPEPIIKVWKTPSGTPASRNTSSMASAHWGTFDECFSIITLPAASAGSPARNACQTGNSRA